MLKIILQIGTRLFCSSSLGFVTLIPTGEIQDGCTMIKVFNNLNRETSRRNSDECEDVSVADDRAFGNREDFEKNPQGQSSTQGFCFKG